MNVLSRRIEKHRYAFPVGCILLPISMIALGFVLAQLADGSLAEGIVSAAKSTGIDAFSCLDFGCVFLFAALVFSSMFLIAPLLIALNCFSYGYFATAIWGFLICRLYGDISVGGLIIRFFVLLLFTCAFIVFAQIELSFCASAAKAFFRNKGTVSCLRRILLSALVAMIVLLSVCRIVGRLLPSAL